MSIAEDEASKYAQGDCHALLWFSRVNTARESYIAGRTAPPTEAEIEACIQYLRDSAGNFGMMRLTQHQFRKLAKGMLNIALQAVME